MNHISDAFRWLNDPLNWTNPNGMLDSLRQHILITIGAVLLASLIALPIGIWFGHIGRGGGGVVAVSNMTRAIPTIAMLTIFVVLGLKLGLQSAIPALAIFAIPPLLANAYLGMRQVDREIRDAARGMGMSGWQMLRRVEIPLATPYLLTGIRTATVQVIATATLAALVSGGGLGSPISQGFGLGLVQGGPQILAGGFFVALLALVVNGLISVVAWFVIPKPLRKSNRFTRKSSQPAVDLA